METPSALTKQKVLVFKTNIKKRTDAKKLHSVLNKPGIVKWNVDFDDCDKVLRVVTTKQKSSDIIRATTKQGFECSVLH